MTPETLRAFARALLSAAYAMAGILHLVRPVPFLAITPQWVPEPALVVALTGLCEIAGAIGLHIPPLRRAAGWGLALYAVCVFPANVHHAFDAVPIDGVVFGWSYHGPRLLMQPVIIWWTLLAAGITNWPFRRVREG